MSKTLAPIEGLGAATSLHDLEMVYDKWSETYESDMLRIGYDGPMNAAKIVRGLLEGDDHKILDMAAGTGLAAIELRKLGFNQIDGSDMSTEILKKAKEKGVYNKIFRCMMGEDPVDSDDEIYSAVTIVGCFSIPVKTTVFQELHRVLKPGGYLIASFRPNTWVEADPYGYRAALMSSPNWRFMSDELLDQHGPLKADKNKEFYTKWHFVVAQKM